MLLKTKSDYSKLIWHQLRRNTFTSLRRCMFWCKFSCGHRVFLTIIEVPATINYTAYTWQGLNMFELQFETPAWLLWWLYLTKGWSKNMRNRDLQVVKSPEKLSMENKLNIGKEKAFEKKITNLSRISWQFCRNEGWNMTRESSHDLHWIWEVGGT